MKNIPDDTNVSNISIPGTHNSGTFDYTIPIKNADCQSWSYIDQLRAGIRYLDLRINV